MYRQKSVQDRHLCKIILNRVFIDKIFSISTTCYIKFLFFSLCLSCLFVRVCHIYLFSCKIIYFKNQQNSICLILKENWFD